MKKGFTLIRELINVRRGFTLIELLVVIAIMGILAVAVLVAINPVERNSQAKDENLISNTNTVYNAGAAYYTLHGQPAPATGTNGQQALVDAGELKAIVNSGNGYPLYQLDTWSPIPDLTYFQVIAGPLKSKANRNKAISIHAAGGPSNCDGTQTNTEAYYGNGSYGSGRQLWYCW